MAAATTAIANCIDCRPTLGRLVKRHTPDACPLRKGSYCGLCASYGHSPSRCPDAATMMPFREPQFLEQLVPPTLLEQYGVTTCTPLLGAPRPQESAPPRIIEVPETEDALRAAILAAGGKPMICQQEKGRKGDRELLENKKRLQKLADAKGQKVIFTIVPGSKAATDAVKS